MALNLSTLTNPATSGDVLAEILTTANFLGAVPLLRNLSTGSNKGGSAKQDVALNQPRALPLIKNPAGKLGGYLYIPNVTGNYATGPSVTIGANQTWEGELDMVITQFGNFIQPMGGGFYSTGFGLIFYSNEKVSLMSKAVGGGEGNSGVTVGTPFNVKYGYDGTDVYVDIDGVRKFSNTAPSQAASITHNLQLGQQNNLSYSGNYAIQKAKLTVNSAVVFDCEFNGSTSIRHGDKKFNCVGGPVSLTRAGQDPVTVVKKDILRFDGVNDGLRGLFANNINGGYMFAAFSVLGNGGEAYGRLFGANINGGFDYQNTGFALRRLDSTETLNLRYSGGSADTHQNLFDDDRGDLLLESRLAPSSQKSKVNDADANNGVSTLANNGVAATRYSISSNSTGDSNIAIDLEYLALFPATITDAQADLVRNYINTRNLVFDLKDGFGYYFYDATKAPVGAISSGANAWNGRIVGSDNGDTDKLATQATANDQPVSDGYVVTFADNSDHLDIPSTTQAGWQVVGTSLGTFVYKINGTTAVTELNLLGNLGSASYRKAGDLYGVILLPESATGADIEAARKLLIDRGAADGTTGGNYYAAWLQRPDIVEFKSFDASTMTVLTFAFAGQTNLVSFPSMSFPNATTLDYGWNGSPSLTSFGTIQAPLCTNFSNAWKTCSALTSFPAGAKLGTSASNVNFDSAWNSSGLTSFSTPLPTATSASIAWGYCSALTQFNLDSLPLVLNVSQAWRNTGLISFNTNLPSATSVSYAWYQATSLNSFGTTDIKNCSDFTSAWQNCSSLTSFPSNALLGTAKSNVNFTSAWQNSGLTSFPADIDLSKGTSFISSWQSTNLTAFSTPLPLASDVRQAFHSCSSITSFTSSIPVATNVGATWLQCSALTSFALPLNLMRNANYGWYSCTSLTDFSSNVFSNWNPGIINSGVFSSTWKFCTSLTAQSVENILTSIAASGQYATSTGASGGTALGNAGIDIDYNVATGSLSAATNTAITSLKSKGWSIIVNNVTL